MYMMMLFKAAALFFLLRVFPNALPASVPTIFRMYGTVQKRPHNIIIHDYMRFG